MTASVLIDEAGETWPANSAALARRLGHSDARLDLASFAVRERGFIHIRRFEDGARVALRPGAFSRVALAGALQFLNDMAPRRILMLLTSPEGSDIELFASVFAFVERAEYLTADPPIEIKVPRLCIERSLRNLTTGAFASVRPIIDFWTEQRGYLGRGYQNLTIAYPAFRRTVLVRKAGSRLVTEYIGSGFGHLKAAEVTHRIGRDFTEMPDRDYGSWVAEAYLEASEGNRLRVESVRAQVRTSSAATLQARYDRILIPWRWRNDTFVMGASIRRELLVAS
jgi:hypothetical protein